MNRPLSIAGGVLLLSAASLVGWGLRPTECRRATSPDGRHHAVAYCRAWRSLVPMPPGSGGDKPGVVRVFTRAGRPCGEAAPLPMAWMLDDMEWSATRASLPLVAEWDLAAC